MKKLLTFAALAMTAALLLVPAAVQARTGHHRSAAKADRNRDRIPDRWERRHRLSLRVKQTRRDQDHDGLNNLGEFRAGTNPRDDDSDDDGVEDGREHRVGLDPRDDDSDDDGVEDGHENAGSVQSFVGGTLTIALAQGGTVSGRVVDGQTEIECEHRATTPTATASHDGEGDDGGSDDEEHSGPGDEHGDDDQGEDDENDEAGEVDCSSADLRPGTVVHEAELSLRDGAAVFHEIELIKPAQ